ncbi:MAG: cyclic nucleotide-binding domain-containing protein [Anaerolineaceae bacterium]|nr:cyclic nucleotide-binding domain-containing protein [Anaerolineaceae bacterium]
MVDQSKEILEILSNIHFFDMLNEEQLLTISEQLDSVFFKQNEIIFEEATDADGFYIVLSGRVSLQQETDHDPMEISICQKGDFFGEEGLDFDKFREVTAQAITNVIAIHINQVQVDNLMEVYPEIIEPIRLTIKSYRLFLKYPFTWRGPREAVHFVARKNSFFLWLGLFPPIILGIFSVLMFLYFYFFVSTQNTWLPIIFGSLTIIFLGWFIWKLIDWSNDFSIITNRRVVSLEKIALFYESRQEAPLDAILSVETRTSQWGRWIGYGDVVIRTYTGLINLKKMSKPDLIVRLINDERGRASHQSNKLQRISKEDTLRSRIGYDRRVSSDYEEVINEDELDHPEVPLKVKSSGLMEYLSTFFGLRMEKNGVIIYRTHWFILLKKVLWPGLALALLLLVFIYSVLEFYPSINFDIILLAQFGIGLGLLGWWLYQFWDWHNDRYIVTDDQLIDLYKRPLGQEQRRSAPIKNIQTVEFERLGLISLILNFGTVFIRVGDTTLTFDYVYNPSKAQQDIFERYQQFNQKQKIREKEALRDEVAEWIEIYHEVVQKKYKSDETTPDEDNSGYNIGEF